MNSTPAPTSRPSVRRPIRQWIIATSLAIPLALASLYAVGVLFGMAGGESWMVGYYGKFNRVRTVIERMPDVRILDSWQHHDVTLEDFGFTITSASGQPAKVDFWEGSQPMALSKRDDIEAYVRAAFPR
jgi:hypothetical protein